MKSHRVELTFNLPARMALVNITPQVEAAVCDSGVREGLVLVNPQFGSDTSPRPGTRRPA